MRSTQQFATGVLLVLALMSLSGCLVTRMQAMQQQTCDFHENFQVSAGEMTRVTFLNPVLRYDDVAFLAGVAPRLEQTAADRYRAYYVIRKEGDPEGLEIPLDLEFEARAGTLRLAQIAWQSPVPLSVDAAEWPLMAAELCESGLPVWRTRMDMPMPEFDRSIIPTREQMIEITGRPTSLSDDGRELRYRFVLEGAEGSELTGTMTLEYDGSGQVLLRSRTRFYHYVTGADFEQGRAWGELVL